MQMSPAIARALSTISFGERSEFSTRARAAACAYGPPDPIARMPCSGSSTSPMPVMISERSLSATASIASRRRSTRSVRQSFASSTAERIRLPWCLSSFASKRSNRVKASAVPPAKPARMRSWYRRRTLRAPPFNTTFPSVTWPSPPSATRAPRRTERIVVPCSCSMGIVYVGTRSLNVKRAGCQRARNKPRLLGGNRVAQAVEDAGGIVFQHRELAGDHDRIEGVLDRRLALHFHHALGSARQAERAALRHRGEHEVRLLVAHLQRHHEALHLDFLLVERAHVFRELRHVAVLLLYQLHLRQGLPGHHVLALRQRLELDRVGPRRHLVLGESRHGESEQNGQENLIHDVSICRFPCLCNPSPPRKRAGNVGPVGAPGRNDGCDHAHAQRDPGDPQLLGPPLQPGHRIVLLVLQPCAQDR